jgi:glutaminase
MSETHRPALPRLAAVLAALHAHHAPTREGEVATYIPALATQDPELFGLAAVTADGRLAEAGNSRAPFTIQSVSKPFAFALLLDTVGRAATYATVGAQPSDDPFNAFELNPRTGRPHNAMINAGAIAVCARLREELGTGAFEVLRARLSLAAGREILLDERVFESERATGHRNFGIAHFLRAAGVFAVAPEAALDLYFRQCSLLVTAADLATMGATLASVGRNPVTGAEVFGGVAVRDTLSVMFTCGLYDGAGDWACRVGLPAKSGVGGGLLAVVNRLLGLGLFSPRLDENGSPVRARRACEELAAEFGLHAFDPLNAGPEATRFLVG